MRVRERADPEQRGGRGGAESADSAAERGERETEGHRRETRPLVEADVRVVRRLPVRVVVCHADAVDDERDRCCGGEDDERRSRPHGEDRAPVRHERDEHEAGESDQSAEPDVAVVARDEPGERVCDSSGEDLAEARASRQASRNPTGTTIPPSAP